MLEHARQLLRFSAVGLCCFGIATAVLAGLCELAGMNYLLAYICSFVVSNIAGYLLNGRFTFGRTRTGSLTYAGVTRYMMVNVVLLTESSILLKWLVDGRHVWYLGASFIIAAINTPISFCAHRLVSYRLGRPSTPSSYSGAAAYDAAATCTTDPTDNRRTS